ncbi:MAG: hypothetical protein VX916_05135 [Planctomycetota bacterium]|nr:hypothetical protein [Planctomycetota bacterium]
MVFFRLPRYGIAGIVVALATLVPVAQAQVSDTYFMAVHGCEDPSVDCHSPMNHQTYLLSSDDGENWTALAGWTSYQGSVPDLIRRGDTLYLYNPNQLVRYHLDTGVLDGPMWVTLHGGTSGGFVDPSLYLDEEGNLVLFYLPGILGSDPAGCPPGSPTCTKYIRSAVETPGTDGIEFDVAGDRLTISVGGGDPPSASDPDIFLAGDTYAVLLARGASTQLWTSDSLHGTYVLSTDLPNGFLWSGGPAVASAFYDHVTGETWLYAHSNLPVEGLVQRAVTTDLTSPVPSSSWSTVLQPSDLGLSTTTGILGSPGLARNITPAGTVTSFGSGCGSSTTPVIDIGDLPPELGQSAFSFMVTDVTPGAAGWILLGSSNIGWGATVLPWSLSGLGYPGCELLVSLDLPMVPVTADATGLVTLNLGIPSASILLGQTFYAQGAFLDASSALEMSGGIAFTLGLQ